MSLITDEINKDSGVNEPKTSVIKTLAPEQPTTLTGQASEATTPPAQQAAQDNIATQAVDPSNTPAPMPSGIPTAPTFDSIMGNGQQQGLPAYVNPDSVVQASQATGPIWQNVHDLYGTDALQNPTIAATKKPTVYNPVADISGDISRQANAYAQTDEGNRKRDAEVAAQQAQAQQRNVQALPGVARVDKPWYAGGVNAVGGFFHDLLFGSEQQQQEAQTKHVFNPLMGEYGDQGAQVGGFIKYLGNLATGVPFAAAGEAIKAGNFLGQQEQKFTDAYPQAKPFLDAVGKFATAPNPIVKALSGGISGLVQGAHVNDPKAAYGFDIEQAQHRNLLQDVLLGKYIGGPGDSYDKHEGVFYSPRYQEKKTTGNIFNDAGQKIQADPLGSALDVGSQLFSPGNAPLDHITGSALGYLFGNAGKIVGKVAGQTESAAEVTTAASQAIHPLEARAGAQAAKRFAREQAGPSTVMGSAEYTPKITQQLPAKTSAIPSTNISGLKPDPGGNVLENMKQALPNNLKGPQQVLSPAKELPALPGGTPTPVKMMAELDHTYVPDPWTTQPLNIKTPTSAPRVPNGSDTVVQKALPGVLPGIEETTAKQAVGTPSELTFNVGIGKPSKVSIPEPEPISTPLTSKPASDELNKLVLNRLTEGSETNRNALDNYLTKNNIASDNLSNFVNGGLYETPEVQQAIANKSATFAEGNKGIDANELSNLLTQRLSTNSERSALKLDTYLTKNGASSDALDKYFSGEFFHEPEVAQAIKRETDASVVNPKATDAELLQARDELASHKLVAEAPKKQLEEYFESNEDFGRRPQEKAAVNTPNLEYAAENNARIQLKPSTLEAIDKISPELGRAVETSDHEAIASELNNQGLTNKGFSDLVNRLETKEPSISERVAQVQAANEARAKVVTNEKLPATVTHEDNMFHGSAIKGFDHAELDADNMSRGELGYGFHMTNDAKLARRYAEATVNGNANPATHALELQPNVTEYDHSFANTLDANANLKSSHPLYNELMQGLTPAHVKSIKSSLKRDAETSYNGFQNKVEAAMVRAKVKPTEANLQRVQKTISGNLQRLGYDSVYDSKSGFTLALNPGEHLTQTGSKFVNDGTIDPMKAVLARYNADAFAAKSYPHRLTSDANLRDSTYRLLSQHQENLDGALRSVQAQLEKQAKQLDRSVLPDLNTQLPAAGKGFKDVQEAFEQYKPISDGPCEI